MQMCNVLCSLVFGSCLCCVQLCAVLNRIVQCDSSYASTRTSQNKNIQISRFVTLAE